MIMLPSIAGARTQGDRSGHGADTADRVGRGQGATRVAGAGRPERWWPRAAVHALPVAPPARKRFTPRQNFRRALRGRVTVPNPAKAAEGKRTARLVTLAVWPIADRGAAGARRESRPGRSGRGPGPGSTPRYDPSGPSSVPARW